MLSQYAALFPSSFNRYFEPFLGSGAVFFYLQPKPSFLSDVNAELCNVYRVVRDNLDELLEDLKKHRNTPDYYYSIRRHVPKSDVARASRILYLNKTCFNGLYRENQKGEFNVPFGHYKRPNWRNVSLLREASAVLQHCCEAIRCAPFESVLDEAREGDFVYLDPPYVPLNKTSSFTAYNSRGFSFDDQKRLAKVMVELHRRGVLVMLSNSDSSVVRNLFALDGFHFREVWAPRSINSVGTRRNNISEVVVRNYGRNS